MTRYSGLPQGSRLTISADRRYTSLGQQHIANLLKASPKGEGFHPSQTTSLLLSE